MSLVFVVGTGRCGSTMLSVILHEHPEVVSLSEFFTILRDPGRPDGFLAGDLDGAQLWRKLASPVPELDEMVRRGMRSPGLRYPYDTGRFSPATGVPLICHGILPLLTDDPDALFDRLAAEVTRWPRYPAADGYRALFGFLERALGRSVTVERSGSSLARLPLLADRFPEARFVHMHRNGPDCALSMSRHPASRRSVLLTEAARLAGLPPSASLAELEPELARLPSQYAELLTGPRDPARLMAHPMPLPAFGERWSAMVRDGVTALRGLPAGSWLDLRYEDLLTGPAAELARLAGFLGVAAAPGWLAAGQRLADPARAGAASAQLPPAELASLRAACEPGAEAIAAVAQRHPAPAGARA